jgi:hypothetical protein
MESRITVDLDITFTHIVGALIVLTGIISLVTVKDAGLAMTCIGTGAGLCGITKIANTAYDNAHDKEVK